MLSVSPRRLAIKHLFLADGVQQAQPAKLILKPFDALNQKNDYEVRQSDRYLLTMSKYVRDRFHGICATSLPMNG